MEYQDIIFWIVFGLFLFIFFGGIVYRISIWLTGTDQEYYSLSQIKKSKFIKFKIYLNLFLKKFFSPDFKKIVLIFFRDGILHVDLFKDSKLKWFIHTFMFWGLVSFFLISTFHSIALTVAPMSIPAEQSTGFIKVFATLENRFTSAALDITKIAILAGVVLAVFRFMLLKNKKKSVELKDKSAGIYMAIIVIFGFLYEASFFIANSTPTTIAVFAPAGFILSLIISFLKDSLNFSVLTTLFFYLYYFGLLAYIAYIPYGKFSHMVFGPYVTLVNRFKDSK